MQTGLLHDPSAYGAGDSLSGQSRATKGQGQRHEEDSKKESQQRGHAAYRFLSEDGELSVLVGVAFAATRVHEDAEGC